MRLFCSIVFSCVLFAAAAQTPQVSYFPNEEENMRTKFQQLADGYLRFDITDMPSQFGYTAKLYKARYGLKVSRLNGKMQVVNTKVLAEGKRAFGPFEFAVTTLDKSVYLVYFQLADETDDGDINIMAAKIDSNTLELSEPVKLLSVRQKNTGFLFGPDLFTTNKLIVMPVPDKSKLFCFWKPGNNGYFAYTITDNTLRPLVTKTEVIKTELKDVEVTTACADNRGNVYIGYKGFAGKIGQSDIMIYPFVGKQQNLHITSGDQHVHLLTMLASKNGDKIHFGGLLTSGGMFADGMYYQSISTTDFTTGAPVVATLNGTLLKRLEKDGWLVNWRKVIGVTTSISLKPYELADGSFDLCTDFIGGFAVGNSSGVVGSSILNVRFLNNTSVITRVPKFRRSLGLQFGHSYFAMPYSDKMLFFYNDDKDNIGKPVENLPVTGNIVKEGVLVMAAVAPDGTISRQIFLDREKEDQTANPEAATPLSGSTFAVPVGKARMIGGYKNLQWATVTIE